LELPTILARFRSTPVHAVTRDPLTWLAVKEAVPETVAETVALPLRERVAVYVPVSVEVYVPVPVEV